jgi:nucleotide-binding universal stress UspA family protein
MYRTIIVGCDGTSAAEDALRLAQRLVDPRDGRLVLASAYSIGAPFMDPMGPILYADTLRDQAHEAVAAAVAALPKDVNHEQRVVADTSPARGLDFIADSEGADLIVLGPTHHGAVGRLTGRTTVQRLLHGAPCALAVAAPGQEQMPQRITRVCVAYDGSEEADIALAAAYRIAAGHGAEVLLCTALEPIGYPSMYAPIPIDASIEEQREREAEKALDAAAARAPDGVAVSRRIARGPAAGTILAAADSEGDLIVTGSRSYGPLRRVLAGSVSIDLLTHAHVPVLVTPRGQRERGASGGGELERGRSVSRGTTTTGQDPSRMSSLDTPPTSTVVAGP